MMEQQQDNTTTANNNNNDNVDLEDQTNAIEIPVSFKRASYLTVAILPLTILPFILLFIYVAEKKIEWESFGYGALGWYIALILRFPFLLFMAKVLKVPKEKVGTYGIALSGPCEESVRVVLVILLGRRVDIERLYSIGAGWAAIEIVFAMVNTFAILHAFANPGGKGDEEKKEKQQQMLQALGKDEETAFSTSPLWGALERISANMTHIGFTLILHFSLYLAIPAAFIHTLFNYGVVFSSRSFGICVAEVVFLLLAIVVFTVPMVFMI